MNIRTGLLLVSLWSLAPAAFGQPRVARVDPPFWWTGMRQDTLELLITGNAFARALVSTPGEGIRILATEAAAENSALFVTLCVLPDAQPGSRRLSITTPEGRADVEYVLHAREGTAGRNAGFGPEDVVYLITPDRFANGDTSIDDIAGMRERPDRSAPYGRHGGDIKGIIDHLDYLKDLGITALWINPLLENDNPFASYHGYAATDLYRIDPRFGSNELYRELVLEAHRKGLKVILDHVSNHISIRHPWVEHPPAADWLHGSRQNHLPALHRLTRLNDPHASAAERKQVVEGWFSNGMPDLHQRNPHLRRYLIQNTIWWLEYTGLDGIREDTYPYCDQEYLNAWCAAILLEYPRLNIVGEVWMNEAPSTASFQRGNHLAPERRSALPTVTDFPLYEALKKTFVRKEGMNALADCFSMDFCYPAPESLLTFADNHDVPRLAFMTGGDLRRCAMVLTVLLTARGIPQLYYGTEIALQGGSDHGTLRADMPGGFPGDTRNAFREEGRTPQERTWFRLVRDLLHLRREMPALQEGRFVHFTPADEIYVYFRMLDSSTVMVAVNNNDAEKRISCSRFQEILPAGTKLRQLTGTGRGDTLAADHLTLEGLSATVYEVVR
jgi:glycosidase